MKHHILRSLRLSLFPVAVLSVLALLIGTFGEAYQVRLTYAFFMNLVLALGVQIFMGNTGVISFGHVGFMGVASYATAILTIPVALKTVLIPDAPFGLSGVQLSVITAAIIALALVFLIGWITGFLIIRVSGSTAEILTLALLVIAYVIFTAWIDLTRGQRSLYGIPVVSSLTIAAVISAGVIFVAKLFRDSPIGLQLRASSEDMLAARAMGVPIPRLRHYAWTLSTGIVGIAGILHATYLGVIGPNSFYFNQTFLTMAMVILGGMRSVSGVIVGTLVISLGNELTRTLENGPQILGVQLPQMFGLTGFFLGAVIVLTMIFRRNGILGDLEFEDLWRKWRKPRPAKPASQKAAISS